MTTRSLNKEIAPSSVWGAEIGGWALFLLLLTTFLLLLQLLGVNWDKINQLTKVLSLAGGGALFQILRGKLQTWLEKWKRPLLVAFTLLLLLNLPFYGISIQCSPVDASIKIDDREASSIVYWLGLRTYAIDITHKSFDGSSIEIPGWRVFFSLWGLFPVKVGLVSQYTIDGPNDGFDLKVDSGKNGNEWKVIGSVKKIPLSAGPHELLIETNDGTGCKRFVVPDEPPVVHIDVGDRCP